MVRATMIAARKLTRKKISTMQDQHHSAQQVVFDRFGGEVDQVAAIVKRMDLHVRRQESGG